METRKIEPIIEDILAGLADGEIVPYLGPGALADVRDTQTGAAIPADSDSLIHAMNGGRPMAPKLMYEFPRAAMNLELKRGRRFIEQFLTKTYGTGDWAPGAVHAWLAALRPSYVVDVNRDLLLQNAWSDTPHVLVRGVARVGGTDYRFLLHQNDGKAYRPVALNEVDPALPVLFKPMGSPQPEPSYIASDADYVDYITELMGGFAIPAFLKARRATKRYLFLGMRFTRDTERMVMSDIIFGAGEPAGWALIPAPTDKERRYCRKKNIEILPLDIDAFLTLTGRRAGGHTAALAG